MDTGELAPYNTAWKLIDLTRVDLCTAVISLSG
jgi:hypothetical protein